MAFGEGVFEMACWAMAYLMYGIPSVTLLKNIEIHNYLIYRIFNSMRDVFIFLICRLYWTGWILKKQEMPRC